MAASRSGLRHEGDRPAVTPMPMPTVVAAILVAVDGFSTVSDPTDDSARFSSTQLTNVVRSVSEHLQHLCSCGQVRGIGSIDIEQCKYACLCVCECAGDGTTDCGYSGSSLVHRDMQISDAMESCRMLCSCGRTRNRHDGKGICTHMHTHVHISTHALTLVHTHTHTHPHTDARTHTCIDTRAHTGTNTDDTDAYAHAYKCTCTHTRTTLTHAHACLGELGN